MALPKSLMVKPQAVNVNKKTTRRSPQPPVAPLPRKATMAAKHISLREREARSVTRAGLG